METVCQHVCQHVFGHCRWGNKNQFLAACFTHSIFRKCGLCGAKRVFSKMAQCIRCKLFVHKKCFLMDLCEEKRVTSDTVTSPRNVVDKAEPVEITRTVEVGDRAKNIADLEISGLQITKDFFKTLKTRVRGSNASDVNNTVGYEATSFKASSSGLLSVYRAPKLPRKSSPNVSSVACSSLESNHHANYSTSLVSDERKTIRVDKITRKDGKITEVSPNHGNLSESDPGKMPSLVVHYDEKKPKKIGSHETICKLHNTRKSAEKQRLSELLAYIDKIESSSKPLRGITEDEKRATGVNSRSVIPLLRHSNGSSPSSVVYAESIDGFSADVTGTDSSTMDESEFGYVLRAEDTLRLGDTFARIAVAKRQERRNRTVQRHFRERINQSFDHRTTEVTLDNNRSVIYLFRDSNGSPPSPVMYAESTDGLFAAVTPTALSSMGESEFDYVLRAEDTIRLGDTFERIAMAKRQERRNRTVTRNFRKRIKQSFDHRTTEVTFLNSQSVISLSHDSIGSPAPSSVMYAESTDGLSAAVTSTALSSMDESEFDYVLRAEDTLRLSDTFARIAMAKRQERRNRTAARSRREHFSRED